MVCEIQGNPNGADQRFAVVVSRFNEPVTQALQVGAVEELTRHGVDPENILVAHVPGAFEIPVATQTLARTGRYAGIICLGALIRGETPHFDYLSSAVAHSLERISVEIGIPVGFGVLTTETGQQALDRCGGSKGNKGAEAAHTVLEMVDLISRINS